MHLTHYKYEEDPETGTVAKIRSYMDLYTDKKGGLPTVEGACVLLKINPDTLVEWCKLYPEVDDIILELRSFQKDRLMNHGMYGGKRVNAAMAIFLLKANHNMKETSVVENKDVGSALDELEKTDYDEIGREAEKQMVAHDTPVQDHGQAGPTDNIPAESATTPTPEGT